MRAEELVIYRSPDERLKTSNYVKNGATIFCVSEKTAVGILITECSSTGEILNQHYVKEGDHFKELNWYLGIDRAVHVEDVRNYEKISVAARCQKCNGSDIRRELDLAKPSSINDIPVVPMFVCTNCRQRFYSVGEHYLRRLVSAKAGLFAKEELEEMSKDEDGFMRTLQEYIIRIYASKKIMRLKLE